MSAKLKLLALPLLVLFGVLGYAALFKVDQWEQAIVFRFREIERAGVPPGLHVMIPFINTMQKFETRLLTLDEEPQRFLTKEKKPLVVDYYVKWRIDDVSRFYIATTGDIGRGSTLLAQRINSALREEFGKRTLQEVVFGERDEVIDTVRNTASKLVDELGISVVDVRTMRIDLPEEVNNSVYARMRSERERVAKDFRARGAEAAERIRAIADRERQVILADAYRVAEEVRGQGDGEATRIYAEAYQEEPEFYDFYRSLQAYRQSFQKDSDILLLTPDSDFFKFFKDPLGKQETP